MNLRTALFLTASMVAFTNVCYAQSVCSDLFASSEVLVLEAASSIESRLLAIESKLLVDQQIASPAEIPFAHSSSFRPISNDEMIKRAADLPPEVAAAITKSYNALNDKAYLNDYFQRLFAEASQWLRQHGRAPDVEKVEARKVSFQALTVVLIKRAKARGEKGFTTIRRGRPLSNGRLKLEPASIEKANDGFRAAIRSGPFFDRMFDNESREGHGRITHLLQRDIVSEGLTPEARTVFFDYLGTKKGVNWWADLFDSGNPGSFTRPETLNAYLTHALID